MYMLMLVGRLAVLSSPGSAQASGRRAGRRCEPEGSLNNDGNDNDDNDINNNNK